MTCIICTNQSLQSLCSIWWSTGRLDNSECIEDSITCDSHSYCNTFLCNHQFECTDSCPWLFLGVYEINPMKEFWTGQNNINGHKINDLAPQQNICSYSDPYENSNEAEVNIINRPHVLWLEIIVIKQYWKYTTGCFNIYQILHHIKIVFRWKKIVCNLNA